MFRGMKLSTKQIAGFVLVALIVGLVGGVGLSGLYTTSRNFDQCMDVEVPRADASMEAIISMVSARDLMGEYLLTENHKKLDELEKEFAAISGEFAKQADFLIKNGTPEIKKDASQAKEQFAAFVNNAKELMASQRRHIESEMLSDKAMAKFDQHAKDLAKKLIDHEKQLTAQNQIDPKMDAAMEAKSIMFQQKAIAEEYMGSESLEETVHLRKEFKAREVELDKLDSLLPDQVVKAHAAYGDFAQKMFDLHSEALAVRAASLKGMTKVDSLSKQAGATFEQVEKLAAASMAETMARADAAEALAFNLIVGIAIMGFVVALLLGVLVSRSISKPIRAVVASLTAGSDQVAAASEQVSGSSQTLAQGASEQAASLEEASSSLEEINSMSKSSADHVRKADELMRESAGVVAKASQSMKELRGSMEKINSASDEMAKIIKTIDEIAFQTNLLALNAAVEAARAGEAGAGFAVVADEVRSLAMRAAEAAKGTQGLIEDNIRNIKEGAELVAATDKAFSEVESASNQVSGLVSEVAAGASEQSQGIGQVNQAMGEMDKVTQAVAANAEESAAAAEELTAQAATMKEAVQDLAVLVEGAKASQQRSLDYSGDDLEQDGRLLPAP